jgi:hypothetical protein
MIQAMMMLNKGDCEHCHRTFRYTLWDALFGEYSYAYCDACGMLATIYDSNERAAALPPVEAKYREIDAAWEPFLAPCDCGGHFKKGAAPRCVHCNEALSAEYAAVHIAKNVKGTAKNWVWQGNWHDRLCMAIADPKDVGNLRHRVDPFLDTEEKSGEKGWGKILGLNL